MDRAAPVSSFCLICSSTLLVINTRTGNPWFTMNALMMILMNSPIWSLSLHSSRASMTMTAVTGAVWLEGARLDPPPQAAGPVLGLLDRDPRDWWGMSGCSWTADSGVGDFRSGSVTRFLEL